LFVAASYLNLPAEALVSDNYQPSDFAWMEIKTNPIDIVIGAIERHEDQLFGYRASYDVIYYAGHSNAGSKTFAINLPNDEYFISWHCKFEAVPASSSVKLLIGG
jgi:hypothetical protein